MQKIKLIKCVKSDIVFDDKKKLIQIATFTVLICISCMTLNLKFSQYNSIFETEYVASVKDYLLYIFAGMNIYTPSPYAIFDVPIIWLAFHLFLSFIIANYVTSSINSFGKQMLIRSESKLIWYASKSIWCFLTILSFYTICIIIVFAASLLSNQFTLSLNQDVMRYVLQTPENVMFNNLNLFNIVLIPFLTSLSLAYLQIAIEIIFNSALSYLSTIVLLICSAFFFTPFLFLNNSMVLRSDLMLSNGINPAVAISINMFIVIVALIVGYLNFKNKDFLEKCKGE